MARPPLPIGAPGRKRAVQLAPKRWAAYARFRDRDGVVRQVEASGPTEAAARLALDACLVDRKPPTGGEITGATRLSVVLAMHLEAVAASERAHSTKHLYAQVTRRHLIPAVGALRVREASVPRLEQAMAALVDQRGPAVAKVARIVLSAAMALAVRHGAREVNPMREVSAVRQPRREVRALDVAQVRALRADLGSDERATSVDLPALVDVMLGSAARIGEALALRWVDVDLGAATVSISGTVVRVVDRGAGTSELIRQDTTKGHRPRAVVVPTFALLALAAQRERHPGSALVFPSVVGGLREVTTVERQWRAFRERHPAWEGITFHDARRAVATAIERGAGLSAAAAQLGHASERITAERYVARAPVAVDRSALLEPFADVLAGFTPGGDDSGGQSTL